MHLSGSFVPCCKVNKLAGEVRRGSLLPGFWHRIKTERPAGGGGPPPAILVEDRAAKLSVAPQP